MGSISFGHGCAISRSENTVAEYDREVDVGHVDRIAKEISCINFDETDLAFYVYGCGGVPRKKYSDLQRLNDVNVVFRRNLLPRYLRFLSGVVASESGLIKLADISVLPEVFSALSEQSMAIFYCLSSRIEGEFIRLVSKGGDSGFDFGVTADPRYVIYLADCDNHESGTGVVEFVSYGVSAPKKLVSVLGSVKRTV